MARTIANETEFAVEECTWPEDSTMKRLPVSSSCIVSVGYDAKTRTLELEYTNGGIYQYFDVGPRVYHQLMRADSHGGFANREIKGVYRYRTIRKSFAA